MQIDNLSRRSRYLAALGIDQWVSRSTPRETVAPPSPRQQDVVPIAADWSGLQAQVDACVRCPLHVGRSRAVFGAGDRQARWLVVGEAPGSEEDRRGEPFVGAAGDLLTAMLAAIELPRDQVFMTNVLKCRPPENRDPRPAEVAQCLPYLHRQIELLQPSMILALGRSAAQSLLGVEQPLSRLRGQVHRLGVRQTPLIATYHPAYLLRVPADKRKAWEDLKFARRSFNEINSVK